VITRHLLGQAGLKADEADSSAVTLIQRFGSAANFNIHLHCLVLDGVYRQGADGTAEFVDRALWRIIRLFASPLTTGIYLPCFHQKYTQFGRILFFIHDPLIHPRSTIPNP